MVENVFVLELDAHNARLLHGLPDADRYCFHPLRTRRRSSEPHDRQRLIGLANAQCRRTQRSTAAWRRRQLHGHTANAATLQHSRQRHTGPAARCRRGAECRAEAKSR